MRGAEVGGGSRHLVSSPSAKRRPRPGISGPLAAAGQQMPTGDFSTAATPVARGARNAGRARKEMMFDADGEGSSSSAALEPEDTRNGPRTHYKLVIQKQLADLIPSIRSGWTSRKADGKSPFLSGTGGRRLPQLHRDDVRSSVLDLPFRPRHTWVEFDAGRMS